MNMSLLRPSLKRCENETRLILLKVLEENPFPRHALRPGDIARLLRLAGASGISLESMNRDLFKMESPSFVGYTAEQLMHSDVLELTRPEQERIVEWLKNRLS